MCIISRKEGIKTEKLKRIIFDKKTLLVISGVLSALPYLFPSLFILSYFSFSIYIFFLLDFYPAKRPLLQSIKTGILFSLPYFLIAYSFFISLYPITRVSIPENLGLFVAIFAWITASILHALLYSVIPLFVLLSKKLFGKTKLVSVSSFILIFILIEKATEYSALAFPWIRICIGQYKMPAFIQLAALGGSLLCDAVILLINALIAISIKSNAKKKLVFLLTSALIFTANFAFGSERIKRTQIPEEKIKVEIIQGNVGAEDFEGSEVKFALQTYYSAAEKSVLSGADIIVLPETAVPTSLSYYEHYFAELSEKSGVSVFLGTFTESENGATRNSAVLFENGERSNIYVKRRLAPFGEFMPYRSFFETFCPWLLEVADFEEDMAQGVSSEVIESKFGKIGTLICYDSIFANESRESVNDGADVIFIVTNDVWYKKSSEVHEHLAHAVLRSIENGRCVVRSSNTGISAIIDSVGRIKGETGIFENATLSGEYYLSNEKTLYSSLGDIIIPILAVIYIDIAAASIARRRKNGKKR